MELCCDKNVGQGVHLLLSFEVHWQTGTERKDRRASHRICKCVPQDCTFDAPNAAAAVGRVAGGS